MIADCRSMGFERWNTRARRVTPVWRVKAWRVRDQDDCEFGIAMLREYILDWRTG